MLEFARWCCTLAGTISFWNMLPLVSNAKEWSLISARNARGEGLLVTACPDSEPLSAAIRTITKTAALK